MPIFSAQGLSTAPVSNIVDEGLYEVKIAKAEGITSMKKQTPGIKMDFVIQSGPPQESGFNCIGRHIFSTLYISTTGQGHEIGLQKLAKLCRAAEIEQADDLELSDFVGKTIVIKVKHTLYMGEPQEDVTDYKKIG